MEAQAERVRGVDGTEKPLSCSAGQLAKLAEMRPTDEAGLARVLDDRRVDRFGRAFLDVLRAAD